MSSEFARRLAPLPIALPPESGPVEPVMPSYRFASVLVASSWALLCAGCGGNGPELASVEGTVTLGGLPLDGAKVVFTPVAAGRPSIGRTDAEGRYVLAFTSDRDGALIGEHSVSISTHAGGDADAGAVGAPERVPVAYNLRTELKRRVEADENVIDFDLESKGKIVQPKE